MSDLSIPQSLNPSVPSDWIPLPDLVVALRRPGRTDAACQRQLRRCAAGLSRAGNARRLGRTWLFHPDVDVDGKPARAWIGEHRRPAGNRASCSLPPGHQNWSGADRQRYLDTRELLRRYDAWRFSGGSDGATERRSDGGAIPNPQSPIPDSLAAWAADRGLSCKPRALRAYRRRLATDGNLDRRGQSRGISGPQDPRVLETFVETAMHKNDFSLAEAWRRARDAAEELGAPIRCLRWFQCWFPQAYPQWAVKYAKRPRKFESDCLPKIQRTYIDIDPLEWISLDGHVLNLRCQAPDAAKSGRSIRPVLTGVLDVRTRSIVGDDIRATENSDGILAGLMQMHRSFGCARHYYADNGEAYKASLGHRVRPKLFDDPRIANLCTETGAQRHNAIPYHGWAKMIESHWRFAVERFEKYFTSWWGNRIETRPEDAAKLPVWEMPTLEEVREAWAEFLKAHHTEPQHGDGMYGLSPDLAMEQFQTELRKLDDDVLRFICARTIGYRRVGRDGVRVDGRLYGHFQESVFKLQAKRVVVKTDPADAGYVWLLDEQTRDVVIASNKRLTGATQEDVREAARFRARMRKIAKQYAPARDFLLDSTPGQIMRKKAERARARQQQRRAELPDPAQPGVSIVRPDLVAPIRAAKRKRADGEHRRPAGNGASNVVQNGFDVLAADVAAPPPQPPPTDSIADLADLYADLPADTPPHADGQELWDAYAEAAG